MDLKTRPIGLGFAVAALLAIAAFAWLWQRAHGPWGAWEAYARAFIEADGRVVDHTADARSTSEGQAYSLFFALAANDRPRFDSILRWTTNNLAQGDLRRQLPAWLWGRQPDGGWGVIDGNSASDADLWLAYTLLEAARLWKAPEFAALGRGLLEQVKARELAQASSGGTLLLPGPQGFHGDDGLRLNPSYYPEFQFRYLAMADADGPWAEVWRSFRLLAPAMLPKGLAPDWFLLDGNGQPQPDPKSGPIGSYDAIRVYLWAGFGKDAELLAMLRPYAQLTAAAGAPPEKVDTTTGAAEVGYQPLGFSGAVLPFLKALGEDAQLELQQQRLARSRVAGNLGQPPHYYDQVLALFGEGSLEGRLRFDEQGRLVPRWVSLCCGL